MNNWKTELQAEARRGAEAEANQAAEDYAVKFMQELCADICKAAGKTYPMPTEKFKGAFETVYRLMFDVTYERHFQEQFDTLLREAKREKAAARRYRKAEAPADTLDLSPMVALLPEDGS